MKETEGHENEIRIFHFILQGSERREDEDEEDDEEDKEDEDEENEENEDEDNEDNEDEEMDEDNEAEDNEDEGEFLQGLLKTTYQNRKSGLSTCWHCVRQSWASTYRIVPNKCSLRFNRHPDNSEGPE